MYNYNVRQFFLKWLLKFASVKSDLIAKYPHLAPQIEYLSNNDPAGGKYLRYAIKTLAENQAPQEEIAEVIKLFHKHQHQLENKDIHSWNYNHLKQKLSEVQSQKTKRQEKNEIKTQGADKVYEDDQALVLHVKTKAGACFYGAQTKWCITMSGQSYYEQYTSSNVVFFFILNKQLPENNPSYKIAVSIQRDLNNQVLKIEYFNAIDDTIPESSVSRVYTNWETIKNIILNAVPNIPKGFLARLQSNPTSISLEEYTKEVEMGENNVYLAKQDSIPPTLLSLLAQDKKEEVRALIAQRRDITPDIITLLSKDKDPNIRTIIASRNDTDPATLLNLAQDKEISIRATVARNTSTPPELLSALTKDPDDHVKLVAMVNERTPLESSLASLDSADDDFKIKAAARERELPSALVNYLAKSPNSNIRRAVSERLYIPDEASAILSKDEDPYIRKRVASHVNTNSPILALLAKDEDNSVRQQVAERATSPEILSFLAKDDATKRIVAGNRSTPVEALSFLSQDEDDEVKTRVAYNYSTPQNIKDQIFLSSGIGDYDTRKSAARSPKMKPELLAKLFESNDYDINEIISENPSTPPEILEKLYSSNYSSTRTKHNVAKNPSTPPELLAKLSESKDQSVVISVAGNPSTPSQTLEELGKKNNFWYASNLVENPSTPPDTIRDILTGKNAKQVFSDIKRQYAYKKMPQRLIDLLQSYGFTI